MIRVFALFLFAVFSVSMNSPTFAAPPCTVCIGKVTSNQLRASKAIQCKNGHRIHSGEDCLEAQIHSLETVMNIETEGLPCCGQNCKEKFPFETVRVLISDVARATLDDRLRKEKTPSLEVRSYSELQTAVDRIENAFNLCCPLDSCGSTLDRIEGCNAATCSNTKCNQTFCYLCLKPQKDNLEAHAHVKGHSGNYWEFRPGYVDRYHWILARNKLSHSLKGMDANVVSEALEARKAMLIERNMWPMPEGVTTSQWIQQVNVAKLSKEKQIELLQNEYVFQLESGDNDNASLIDSELQNIGGKVLVSLDVKDGAGIHRVTAENHGIAASARKRMSGALGNVAGFARWIMGMENRARIQAVPGLNPVFQGDPRISPAFAQIGPRDHRSLYQIEDLILSDTARVRMTHSDAEHYCRERGGRLPTREEWRDIILPALSPDNRYNPALIPNLSQRTFWSSSVNRNHPEFAYVFSSDRGVIREDIRDTISEVRCVIR